MSRVVYRLTTNLNEHFLPVKHALSARKGSKSYDSFTPTHRKSETRIANKCCTSPNGSRERFPIHVSNIYAMNDGEVMPFYKLPPPKFMRDVTGKRSICGAVAYLHGSE